MSIRWPLFKKYKNRELKQKVIVSELATGNNTFLLTYKVVHSNCDFADSK